eukprot:2125730-Prymnesium_polylepis.1
MGSRALRSNPPTKVASLYIYVGNYTERSIFYRPKASAPPAKLVVRNKSDLAAVGREVASGKGRCREPRG